MNEETPKVPYKAPGFFKKGNTYAKGRPNISLSKPDVLLPAIFTKAKINWARDFTALYKIQRERRLTEDEMFRFKILYDLLPYLIVKVTLKEGDLKKYLDQGASIQAARATSALLASLEADSAAKSSTTTDSNRPSVGNGESVLPSAAKPETDL